jgi:hypothetical protein
VDLYEQKDIGVVLRCLDSLGRTVQRTVPEWTGPQLGVRLATENVSGVAWWVGGCLCAL